MVWQSTSPDGTKSVSDNVGILQANTTYTETKMQLDHFWNEGSNQDGHHKWMQTVATNDADSSLPTNVARATDMDLVFFSRFKTATEAPDNQDVQPYAKNAGAPGESSPFPAGVMQLLGIRAMALAEVTVSGDITVKYSHNLSSLDQSSQIYTATFAAALPTNNYLFLGGASNRTGGGAISVNPAADTTITNVKSTAMIKFTVSNTSSFPNQIWFICFGG